MARKSEYLQIRLSPAQKAALKRRARRAGQDLSAYVLSRALPPERARFEEILRAIEDAVGDRYALASLNDFLSSLGPQALGEATGGADVQGLSPLMRNYVAAMVEQAAQRGGVDAPGWTRKVSPLGEPFFATPLPGLRLHLLKASPVAFKRRNLFVDSSIGERV